MGDYERRMPHAHGCNLFCLTRFDNRLIPSVGYDLSDAAAQLGNQFKMPQQMTLG